VAAFQRSLTQDDCGDVGDDLHVLRSAKRADNDATHRAILPGAQRLSPATNDEADDGRGKPATSVHAAKSSLRMEYPRARAEAVG
jgi:hypothetical protein